MKSAPSVLATTASARWAADEAANATSTKNGEQRRNFRDELSLLLDHLSSGFCKQSSATPEKESPSTRRTRMRRFRRRRHGRTHPPRPQGPPPRSSARGSRRRV